ncbi:MAG: SusD/RagB family nutrient-binding outer membrane lipoprotein [Phocaeicola sp.]
MKKNKFTFAILLSGMLGFSACTDNFEAMNQNETAFTDDQQEYDSQKQLIPFKTIQRAIIYQTGISGSNWQYQVMQNLVADMFGGYFHDMNGSFNSQNSTYALNVGWCAAQWDYTYAQGFPVILTAEELSKKASYMDLLAVAKILKVTMMHRVSDYYGPILYTNFGQSGGMSESQEEVYKAFFKDLDEAVSDLNKYISEGKFERFSETDIMMPAGKRNYAQWVKFANSLRLRLALRVSNIDKTLAQEQVTKALDPANGGVLTSFDETVGEYGVSNPLGGVASWSEVYLNASMESFLGGFKDPRMAKYFVPAVGGTSDKDELFPIKGTFKGIRQGTGIVSDNRYSKHSQTSITPKSDIVVMTAAEVWFLRAEAALRGLSTGESAEECYKNGIQTSFLQWGVNGVAEYLGSEEKPSDYLDAFDKTFDVKATTDITPKWDNTADREKQLEQIITQKWIAMYPEGCEAWAEQRRTGYPKLFKVAVNNSNGVIDTDVMIRRAPFPQAYISSNPTLYNKLKEQLKGEDNGGTRLWWDTGINNF